MTLSPPTARRPSLLAPALAAATAAVTAVRSPAAKDPNPTVAKP